MSFISVLEAVGKDFEHGLILVLGDANRIAAAEEPVLAKISPEAGAIAGQIAALTSQALGIATQTEQKLQALGKTDASIAEKAAQVAIILAPAVAQVLGLAGLEAAKIASEIATSSVNILAALPSSVLKTPTAATAKA